jgi:hypothetical protein
MRSHAGHALAALTIVAATALAAPTQSHAAVVDGVHGFVALPGERNDVTMSYHDSGSSLPRWVYRDPGAPLSLGPGCEPIEGGAVCDGPGRIDLSDRDDRLEVVDLFNAGLRVTARGGAGDDHLQAGVSGGTFAGGRGDDTIRGRFNGNAVAFSGGPGDDALTAEQVVGSRISGGDGRDYLTVVAWSVGVPGQMTVVSGGAGIDRLRARGRVATR